LAVMLSQAKRHGWTRGMNVKTARKRELDQSTRIVKPAPTTVAERVLKPSLPKGRAAPTAPPHVLRQDSSVSLSELLGGSLSLGDEQSYADVIHSRKCAKPPRACDLTLRDRQHKKNGRRGSVRDRPSQRKASGSVMESITVGGHTLRWRCNDRTNATGRGLLSQAVVDERNRRSARPRVSAEARAAALEPEQITQHCGVLFGAGRADQLPEDVMSAIQRELHT
jgi:hypothetical protein